MKINELYNFTKEEIVKAGYISEIEWFRHLPETITKDFFYREYSFVVICSGLREQVGRGIYNQFWDNDHPRFIIINHEGKRKALMEVYNKIDKYFNALIKTEDKLSYCQETLPYIGKITKYHLLKNLGLDYAKPDRHLNRIAELFGYNNVQEFCQTIADKVNEKRVVIDVILWRFANLFPNYLDQLKEYL